MTSKINALSTGAGGIATTADASGILEIQTNSTTAMTVSDSQVLSFNNNFGTVAGLPSYQCRAWVNFNGTGTVAIRESGNVSSITDNGTGDYTVNFTTAMTDASYVFTFGLQKNQNLGGSRSGILQSWANTTYSTTSCQLISRFVDGGGDANEDPLTVNVAFFR